MFKLNLVIFMMAIVAVAKGQKQLTNNNSALQTNTYINFNRQQYANTIQDLDMQIQNFKQNYADGLDTINTQRDMLVNSLVQNEEKLNPLEILSDLSKECVTKYRSYIPTITETKTKLNECVSTASNQLPGLLQPLLQTRNKMENYLVNTFEKNVHNCKLNNNNFSPNYTDCVTYRVNETNAYIFSHQNDFATELDKAQCSGKINIKKALNCSYEIHRNTTSAIAVANNLINTCLSGQAHSCTEVYNIRKSEVNYNSRTMENPFYKRYTATECLLLELI